MTTIPELAGQIFGAMERRERANGAVFYTLKDGSPAWMAEAVHEAHGDMMPDNWRYAAIWAAAGAIHDRGEGFDSDDLHEIADGLVDAYSGERVAWPR